MPALLQRSLLALPLIALAVACTDSTTDTPDASAIDAAPPRDSGVRDATPNPDAIDGEDLVPLEDAAGPDAAEMDAAAPDAAEMDAAEMDAGVGDAGPCGPVARNAVCGALAPGLAAYLQRCNPELTGNEASALAATFCDLGRTALEDPAVGFNGAAAGLCGCELAQAACDPVNPLLLAPSCGAILTGTIAAGDVCAYDHRCQPGHYCHRIGVSTFWGNGFCGTGTCRPVALPNGPCVDPVDFERLRCAPGNYCDTSTTPEVCRPEALAGESCEDTECRGANSGNFFTELQCHFEKSGATCEPPGRAGGNCFSTSCHQLYSCDPSYNCVLRPGDGDACALPVDVADPDVQEFFTNLWEMPNVCRVNGYFGRGPGYGGYLCTWTGTTSGQGTCLPPPQLGQPCGVGQGLSPICARGTYCAAIDPGLPAPVTGTCVGGLVEGSTCSDAWDSFGGQCELGTFCPFQGKGGVQVCTLLPTDLCAELD